VTNQSPRLNVVRLRTLSLLGIVSLVLVGSIQAQTGAANGSISGKVVDPQKRAVANAKVTIKNTDFGTSRTLTSDPEGNFVAISLFAGNYSVQAEAQGFKEKKLPRVALSVGSSVRLELQLVVAGISQQITVTGRAPNVEGNTVAPEVNKQEVEVGNFLAGLTVTYLPNRDRDFSQFGQLAAGVMSDPNRPGLAVAGQRPEFFKSEIDGASFNDPLQGGMRGAHDTSLFFPQTVIREFQIVHAGVGSGVGGTNAGFLNIVTKEGSNKFHGEAFYIGRPSWWTSDDAFGHSLDNTQNEFGGSIGGPLVRNRAFFYVGVEQDFLNVPFWTQFEPQAPGIGVPVSLLALQQQTVEKTNPTAFFGRADFILNPVNTLNLQINYNRLHATNLSEGSTRIVSAPSHLTSLDGDSVWVRGSLNTLFGSRMVNQTLVAWSHDRRDFVPVDVGPEIFINGFGVLGGNSLCPQKYTSDQLQATDDLAIAHRSAILHLGAQFGYEPATLTQQENLNGRFDFDSLTDYLNLQPRRYRQTFIGGNANYDVSVRRLGVYLDGQLPLNPKITLTAGLRWDGQWNPQPSAPNPLIPQTTRIPNDLAQWQPRVGLAWGAARNTVVRLSSGIYDAPTPSNVFQRVFTDNGINTIVADSYFDPQLLPLASAGGLHSFSTPPSGLGVPAALVVGISPSFRNPRSFQASATVEQQIAVKISVQAGFLRNSTWDLQTRADQNLFPPTIAQSGMPIFPAMRPMTQIGQLLVNQSSAHSSYNGLLITTNLQVSPRTQITANYTLSSTRDDSTSLGPFAPDSVLNPFNPAADRGYSNLDVRNNFNVSAVINLPFGFKVNPILIARSGLSYTPIIGFDIQNDANDANDRAVLNGLVAPRNSGRQPAFANLDVRFVKDFTLPGEGHHLDLFLDVFNLTASGNMNFGTDATSYYGTSAAPVFSAGQALFAPDTNHFGGARQIQFTARLVAF
jgi:hypothetical protein